MDLTLPTYLYLKYGILWGFIIGVLIVYVMYIFCCKIPNSVVSVGVACILLTFLLGFFEWSMFFTRLKYVLLSILMILFMQKIGVLGGPPKLKFCLLDGAYNDRGNA